MKPDKKSSAPESVIARRVGNHVRRQAWNLCEKLSPPELGLLEVLIENGSISIEQLIRPVLEQAMRQNNTSGSSKAEEGG
jgi:hypothetical protein